MIAEQVSVAADCLHMDPAVAATRARQMRDGIICVSSDVRGVGSVLVGPDLTVLFFVSSLSPEQALAAWDEGRRTPREWFAALLPRGELISAAIVVSLHDSAIPSADRGKLVAAYGENLGERLFGEVGVLVREATSMPIDWGDMSLVEGVRDIMTRFGERHPDLSDDALNEIGRCVGWQLR